MTSDHTFDVILKELRTLMNDTSDVILTSPLPLEEYRKLQGQIEGYAIIERFILDLEKKQIEQD